MRNIALIGGLYLFTGCAGYSADRSMGAMDEAYDAMATAATFTADTGIAGAGPGGEIEDDFLALPPAVTDVFIFIANPARNTVTRVNVDTLDVDTTEVGVDPQIAITTPDHALAVVFNRGDDSVSILDTSTLEQDVVAVRDDMNAMKLSPDGRFAVLWHDRAAERPDDPPVEGLQSFNEASFVDLHTLEHWPMAVGFDPKDVVFTPDATLACVISDGDLATVDLQSTPLLPRLIPLSTELEPPVAEEVVLAPDGSYAFVRQFGASEVLVVDLLAETVDPVPVGLSATDLDLSPDGTKAVVVSRGSEELWVLRTNDPFALPDVYPLPAGQSFGSLLFDPLGNQAVLYTTASLVDRYAVWDLVQDGITEHHLEKPVAGMAINPTGEALLVFHTLADAPDADPSSPFFGEWALTTVDLTDYRSNPLLLPAEPIGYATSQTGRYGYFTMDGERYLEALDFQTLLHEQIELKSDPVFVGVLPRIDETDEVEPIAWVSQDHELGRISFYDATDASVETLTGFELNSGVE